MRGGTSKIITACAIGTTLIALSGTSVAAENLDRTVLPIPEPRVKPITTLDARDAKAPPRFEVKAPAGAPNVVIVLIDDIGFGHSSAFGGPINMPTLREAGEQRAEVQPLSHHGAVQPHAHGVADRAQSSPEQRRRDHGAGDGVSRQHRRAPADDHDARRDPAPERLQHGGVRQVSRDAAVGGVGVRAVRSLADGIGLRQVLWIHRRRDEPVGAGHLRRRDADGDAADAGLSLHHGHDRQGDQLGQRAENAHAGQAVLHVFRHRRDARAAPRAEGVDREIQRPVRRRLGQAARGNLRAAEKAGRDSGQHASSRRAPRKSPRGTT